MTLHTRRHVLSRGVTLGAGVGVTTALAGCADSDSSTDSASEGTLPDEDEDFLPEDLEIRRLWFDTDEEQLLEDNRDGAPGLPYLTNSDHATEIEFPTDPVDAETEDPVEFLEGIEYEAAIGLAIESRTPACYEDAVQYVEWRSDTRLGVQLCQTFRDADASCEEGREYTQLTLIEVPTTIEGGPTGSGQGWNHRCSGRPDSSERGQNEEGQ